MTFKNKIMNNSSLFVNFVKNAVTASPKVQSNFLEILLYLLLGKST